FQGTRVPAKTYLENDPYDNQNGEIEYADEGIPCQYVHHETEEIEIRIL
ncbi:MAG TPA: transglutaminase, partial [Erysipelotrichaceae bacterium]|nr:transglutaminase [Erysipelotrichaceae bacterium]